MKPSQIFQKIIIEQIQSPQIFHIVRRKVQVTDIFDDLFQAGCDGITAVTRVLSVESIKYNNLIGRVFKVSLHHG